MAVALAVFLSGCGKKGDPLPPLLPIPRAAEDLSVQQRGGELILAFAYPRTTAAGMQLGELERIEVYELVRPALEAPVAAAALGAPTVGGEAEAPAETAAGGTAPVGETAHEEPGDSEAGEETAGGPAGTVPAAETATSAETASTETASTETAGGTDTTAPIAGEPAAPPPPPAERRWGAPPVDAREFVAASKVVLTLRGAEIAGAVRGDRLVLSLPLAPRLPTEPPADPPLARLYAVRTVAEGDFASAYSNRAAIVPQDPPPAPAGLTVSPRGEGIEVGWQVDEMPQARIMGFNVYRRLATERDHGEPLQFVGPAQRSFLDSGVRYGQRYVYAVTSVARRVPLIESAIAAAREVDYRDTFAPPPPASVAALADAGAVRVVWSESRNPDLAGYLVYRRRGDGEWRRLTAEPTTAVEHVDRDVAAGETYAYRVTAIDELGNESEPSAVAETVVR